MEKKETKKKVEKRVQGYREEYLRWLNVLDKIHNGRFANNYRQYTAYTDIMGTESKISDPVAPELIERIVQKLFEAEPKFYIEARGNNLPKEIKNVMSGVISYFWHSPEMVHESGSMRSRLKKVGREFCITGNAAVETFYNQSSEMPDMRIIPIEDVIFDPSKTLKTSKVYYVRQFVDIDYLKDNVEVLKGGKKIRGIFKESAIKQLEAFDKEMSGKKMKQDPTSNRIIRSGSSQDINEVGRFQLISRWEGKKCCRFIYDQELDNPEALHEFENNVLGEDPLDFVMDIEVPKQPYAFSILDFLSGLTEAKDLFINQLIDYGSKVLNPPLFVDPSLSPVNRHTLSNAWKTGGLVFSPPQQAEHKVMPPLGNFGFDMLGYIQSRSEQVSGVGAYTSGVPNQQSDKTEGTKGGIQALIAQAVSPIRDRQMNIEESIIEPVVNKWLKLAGSLMTDNEMKWVMISGESSKWVGVTKGLLTGKIKLADLMTAGLVEDEEAGEIIGTMVANEKSPEQDVMFDVDWIVRVETGSLAEADTEKDLRGMRENALLALQMGVNIDKEKVWKEIARRSGMKDPDQYVEEMSPEMEQMQQMGMGGEMGEDQRTGGNGLPSLESPKPQVPMGQQIGQGPRPSNII